MKAKLHQRGQQRECGGHAARRASGMLSFNGIELPVAERMKWCDVWALTRLILCFVVLVSALAGVVKWPTGT